ncbi:hypothetical protein EYF80_064910 [Liparis tanakae]|uniref:Uncharacterized protein n=1 Tax=Liparis tanakae TaxID=230148 RepID=A0A4Z2E8G2_9TELE|nr:hypothetical protein EYF80_064910 [Liparis tanakae]
MFLKRASDRTFRASVSSFRTALVSRFPFSARVSRCGRAASAGSSSRKASSVSSLKPISMLTSVEAWRCRCAHRRSMSRAARGMPDRSNAPLDRGADSTAFRLETHGPTGRRLFFTIQRSACSEPSSEYWICCTAFIRQKVIRHTFKQLQ